MPEKQLSWVFRIGGPVLGLAFLGLLLWGIIGAARYLIFLSGNLAGFFEKDGFCFWPAPEIREGVCWLDVWYENRYERPCESILVIKPAQGFFLTRRNIQGLVIRVDCDPASVGRGGGAWPGIFDDHSVGGMAVTIFWDGSGCSGHKLF